MFSKKLFFCAIGIAFLFAATTANAYYNPGKPTGYINDFTKTLSDSTIQQLNSELTAFEKSTSHQIFVGIIPSMKGDYIEYFALKLFEDWKPGQEKTDNGILFLISMEERATRIEVGYGLEGILPDTKAKNILDNITKPYFKQGDFDNGVIKSVQAIESIIKGEVVDFKTPTKTTKNFGDYIEIFFVWGFWFFIIAVRFATNVLGKTKSWWAGGVIGGVIGIILGLIFFSMIGYWVLLMFFFLTGGGFLLDYLASTGKIKPGKGGKGGFWFFGGGHGGGGGFGGGGFGGGGGGFSGGGGASGRW